MMDTTQLKFAKANLDNHFDALIAASNSGAKQTDVDSLTAELTTVDQDLVKVLNIAPNGPPATGIDYTAFDAAVAAFKADSNLSQKDVDAVAHVITLNTP